jgi:uncharacterized protein (TIGR03089 family)
VTGLPAWTGGLAGERDPAQPLLTLLDGPARVELSGATTANWVAKSANLLVDGLGSPERIGLLLPLHWQSVALLLAGVAAGAEVVLAADPRELEGCPAVFTSPAHAEAALDAGADDVLALSGHPLGAPCGALPPLVLDYAREVPSYGDGWSGPRPTAPVVRSGGGPVEPLDLPLGQADRVLLAGTLHGSARALLGVLRAGAALVLLPEPGGVDLARAAAQERATASWGIPSDAVPSLG